MTARHCFGVLCVLLAAGAWAAPAAAQQQGPPTGPPPETRRTAGTPDSVSASPTAARPGAPRAGADTTGAVVGTARDSLVIVFGSGGTDRGTLYGASTVNHGEVQLSAEIIDFDLEKQELRARSPSPQSDRPSFQRGQGGQDATSFTGETLSYNLQTQRGRVVGARTTQSDALIQGEAVKVYEDSTVFVQQGTYTTCSLQCRRDPSRAPSYSLRSSRMKVQGNWVYTGPIQLHLFNIPTPLWLPFGFLPAIQGRRSGPLPPEYGEDRRGLFLRGWGWYFALNDYTDLQIEAGVWSQGSYELRPLFRYRKRNAYNGQLRLTFSRFREGESRDPDFVNRYEGQLRWTHSQEINPTSNFGGNINLVTSSDFARRNTESFDEAVSQQISSNVRYSKEWAGGARDLSVSANQQQQLQSGQVSLTLPSLNFSQRSFKPFARAQRVGDERWYEKITTQYSLSVDNSFSYRPRDPERLRARGDSALADRIEAADINWYEAVFDRDKYRLATGGDEPFDFEARHRIPLNASFRVNRFNANISPNINYSSDWRISTVRKRLVDPDTTSGDPSPMTDDEPRLEEFTVPGFYAQHDFGANISTSSEVFGTFPLAAGPFEGLRHRMRPSLSARYRPNFNNPIWGRTRTVATSDTTEQRYNIVTGSVANRSTAQRSLNFSLDNDFETKRVRIDSTGERETETLKLLDFDLSTGYNFAADAFPLSDIRTTARTDLFDRYDLSLNMTFSPYAVERVDDESGDSDPRFQEVDEYLAARTPWKPLRLTRFRLSVRGSFRGDSNGGPRPVSEPRANFSDAANAGRLGPYGGASIADARNPYAAYPNTPTGYVDFSVPWSLSFSFNYSFRRPANEVVGRNAVLDTNFDFSVTPKWKVSGRTGYDLVQGDLATTRISINRDLCCWTMSFSWVPFGEFQQYSFNLAVKSGKLSQLLRLQLPRQGDDSRLGGIGQQLGTTVQGFGQGRSGF